MKSNACTNQKDGCAVQGENAGTHIPVIGATVPSPIAVALKDHIYPVAAHWTARTIRSVVALLFASGAAGEVQGALKGLHKLSQDRRPAPRRWGSDRKW